MVILLLHIMLQIMLVTQLYLNLIEFRHYLEKAIIPLKTIGRYQ